jgi:hypothetical protein
MQEKYRDAFAGSALNNIQIYENITLYERYQEYFRGKHYLSFSKQDQARLLELGTDL